MIGAEPTEATLHGFSHEATLHGFSLQSQPIWWPPSTGPQRNFRAIPTSKSTAHNAAIMVCSTATIELVIFATPIRPLSWAGCQFYFGTRASPT